ncbi:hypothetical protein [Methylobacillus flagellatus]|uniref:Transmembrane protein n=2 Tax=root TaxID=1 RepID=Q1H2P9_METFK|nr:hypothetical protein [Methylobacillus flagellatus]ABE49094.1 hypothetical protein Mfla_0826 [Methylobacillus flagellatus KT]ABE49238.1 hypothetical protein Mfla_0970 [Methylobacillus flagellatus KT]ABZ07574.1 hypothetical protein ALOHA_HF4000ANIW137K11ctg1g1 [uncultured marine microorganism HF4000_ANIW137K11]
MALQLWDDLKAFSIKDALDIAAFWNQQEIAKGVAKTTQQQAEWQNQASLLTLQAQMQAQALQANTSASNNRLLWVAVIAGAGLVGFMLLRGK